MQVGSRRLCAGGRGLVIRAMVAASVLGLVGWAASGVRAAEQTTPVVRIGLTRTLFHDIPEPLVRVSMQPFQLLMKARTGVQGELVVAETAEELARYLAEGRVHIAVFHGYEFAWAKLDHPTFQPFMIAVNQRTYLTAHVMVRKDSRARALAELQGHSLTLPRGSPAHCGFYLERQCGKVAKEVQQYFDQFSHSPNAEEALDDVVDGRVDAAVVDGVGLECYQRRKPGRFVHLKDVQQSETFPAPVIAIRPGVIAEATLQRFRDALVGASKDPGGRQLLMLWKLTGFENIPTDYERTLAEIAKTYPPPPPAKGERNVSTP